MGWPTIDRLVDYITILVFNIQLKCMFPYLSHITILVQVSFGEETLIPDLSAEAVKLWAMPT